MQKTSFPIEVLIHDDASTDGSAIIIKEYEDKYPDLFKPIYQKENQYSKGVNIWCDIQFPRVKGKYIAICEGDDFWTDPYKTQKQVDFLEANDDFVMCCTAFSQSIVRKGEHGNIVSFDMDEITLDDILKGLWIGTLTTVFRKDAIIDYDVPFDNLPMGDLPLWAHLASKGRIKYLRDVTANYRQLENSASHKKDEKQQFIFDLAAMKVREHYAISANRTAIVASSFFKRAHYILEQVYSYKWAGFPVAQVWHFLEEYGNPSGYDRLKYWGLKSNLNYFVSRSILRLKHKF